ncbi:MAG: phosphatase PAP2 family protein [Pseudomonadales bacterium]
MAQPISAKNPFLPLVGCAVLYCLVAFTALDESVSRLFYDETSASFRFQHHFVLQDLLHEGARILVFGFAFGVLAAIPLARGRTRRALIFTLVSMVVSSAVVALVKHHSTPYCPYELLRFGGTASGSGQCWPSGHASVGFSLFAVFFALRWLGSSWANASFWFALLAGLVLTFSQTIRGMHFISHGVYTGLFIWLIDIWLARVMLPDAAGAQSR